MLLLKDETGYSVLYYLNGYIFVMEAGGLLGGYSDETLGKLADIAKEWNVSEVVIEGNFGDGMYCKLFEPILLKKASAKITEVRSKGQKELRILDTLEPVVTNHKMIVKAEAIRKDFDSVPDGDFKYACFYQFSRLTADRGSLVHDDRLDALAIGVQYLVDIMGVDDQKGIEELTEQWLEDSMESLYRQTISHVGNCLFIDSLDSEFVSILGKMDY